MLIVFLSFIEKNNNNKMVLPKFLYKKLNFYKNKYRFMIFNKIVN